jgi:TetR/AcrR family transcriptional regulator, tetracycline repressor protein
VSDPDPPLPGTSRRTSDGREQRLLSESSIVACALEVIRNDGVEGLTMRVLADRLGVSVAAAYKHVADKETLLRLAANQLFSQVEEGDVEVADWIARLRALMLRFYDVMTEHPGMSSFIGLEPDEFPRRHMAATMHEILLGAGFDSDEAWDVLTTFVFLASGALDGPIRRRDLGPNKDQLLRAAYGRALERVLDGLQVARIAH